MTALCTNIWSFWYLGLLLKIVCSDDEVLTGLETREPVSRPRYKLDATGRKVHSSGQDRGDIFAPFWARHCAAKKLCRDGGGGCSENRERMGGERIL